MEVSNKRRVMYILACINLKFLTFLCYYLITFINFNVSPNQNTEYKQRYDKFEIWYDLNWNTIIMIVEEMFGRKVV